MIRALQIGALAFCLSGCLLARKIEEVAAHDRINSYKVQTMSIYSFGIIGWEVWNCYKTSAGFHCHLLEYDQAKAGFQPEGALPPAPPKAELPPPPPAEAPPPPAPEGDG